MSKHDLSLLWRVALAAREHGHETEAVSKALGITSLELEGLLASWEPLAQAMQAGVDSRRLADNSPQDKILASLSPDAKQIWLDIKMGPEDKSQAAQVLLAQNGALMKQRLFALGLMETNYQVARVLKLLNISKKELDSWTRDYPEFQELLTEIQFVKKNLAEQALFSLIESGEPRAVLFANERLNKETYGNEVKISGEITQAPGVLDLAALGLPFELEKQILAHISSKALLDSDGTLITGN
jgi:hypothetical protein